jgi:hypothetical protein
MALTSKIRQKNMKSGSPRRSDNCAIIEGVRKVQGHFGGYCIFANAVRPAEKVVARSGVLTARRGVAALSACLRIGLVAGVDMNHVPLFAPEDGSARPVRCSAWLASGRAAAVHRFNVKA